MCGPPPGGPSTRRLCKHGIPPTVYSGFFLTRFATVAKKKHPRSFLTRFATVTKKGKRDVGRATPGREDPRPPPLFTRVSKKPPGVYKSSKVSVR